MEVKRIAWSDQAAKKLDAALSGAASQIQHEVESGISELWLIDNGSYLVTRLENNHDKTQELVFVAGAGKNSLEIILYFKNIAKKMGVQTMRLHSSHKGMARLIKPAGFAPVETVYKAVI